MDEKLKNRLLIGLGVLCVFLIFSSVSSCNSTRMERAKRHLENQQKLEAEEKSVEGEKQLAAVKAQLSDTQAKLAQAQSALEENTKTLTQEKMVNRSLKEDLDKLSKLNEALEQDLKEARMGGAEAAKPKK